jgi:hypothetical protein
VQLRHLWSKKRLDASLFYIVRCLKELAQTVLFLAVEVERLIKDRLWRHSSVPP